MSRFDTAPAKTGDFFARHNPERLKGMFGTTEVTPLWVADMDFAVADPIQEALRYVAERGQFAYEINPERIFQAISGWHQRRHGLTLKPENFVAFPGVLTAIALLIRELSDEGDGIVIQVPVYHQFAKLISTAGREIVTNPMINTDGTYTMDFDDLERKLAPETVKLMLLCNPHNPVGRVWRDDELARLVEIAERHNVTVISDEVHADIIYGDHTFNSLATLDNGRHVTVLGSPAKTFGMQSIANGYIYTENDAFFARMKHIEESMYLGHGNAFTTHATIAAYEKGDAWVNCWFTCKARSTGWQTICKTSCHRSACRRSRAPIRYGSIAAKPACRARRSLQRWPRLVLGEVLVRGLMKMRPASFVSTLLLRVRIFRRLSGGSRRFCRSNGPKSRKTSRLRISLPGQ